MALMTTGEKNHLKKIDNYKNRYYINLYCIVLPDRERRQRFVSQYTDRTTDFMEQSFSTKFDYNVPFYYLTTVAKP